MTHEPEGGPESLIWIRPYQYMYFHFHTAQSSTTSNDSVPSILHYSPWSGAGAGEPSPSVTDSSPTSRRSRTCVANENENHYGLHNSSDLCQLNVTGNDKLLLAK